MSEAKMRFRVLKLEPKPAVIGSADQPSGHGQAFVFGEGVENRIAVAVGYWWIDEEGRPMARADDGSIYLSNRAEVFWLADEETAKRLPGWKPNRPERIIDLLGPVFVPEGLR